MSKNVTIIVGLLMLLLSGCCFNDTNYEVVITGKERITTSEHSYYLIFADDINTNEPLVFSNQDELLRGKFKSSNMQGFLKEGHKYILCCLFF